MNIIIQLLSKDNPNIYVVEKCVFKVINKIEAIQSESKATLI